MSADMMRFVDHWLGVPLCACLKVFELIERVMPFKRKMRLKPRILYIKLSEMGGIILSYSLLRKMQEEFPGSSAYFLTFRKNKPIVEALRAIPPDNILTIRDDSAALFVLDTFMVLLRLSRIRVDITFDLELFARFTAALTYLSAATKRIGNYGYYFEGLYRGDLLTHNVLYNPLLHTSKSFLSMAQVVKSDRKDSPELERPVKDEEIAVARFEPGPEDVQRSWVRLEALGVNRQSRIILINPGDGIIPLREWPIDNFIALARLLLDDQRNRLVIIGTEGASAKAGQLCQSLNSDRCLDLTDKTTVDDVLALFSIADSLIVNDCGLAHIASLTRLKKFVLFGPESPRIYSPLGGNTFVFYSDLACSPCLSSFNHRKSACRDNRCLRLIQPQEVFRVIRDNYGA
jgi:ADP-heptose:LPS heptosyltransferase